jgi:hypothetical protein
MKRLVWLFLVALVVAGPVWAQVDNIGASSVVGSSPDPIPVGVSTLCFTVNAVSPDFEYMDRFEVDLPDGWTLGTIASNSVPPANGCSGALPPVVGSSAGNVVYWQSTGTIPTGCGAWIGGSAGTNFDFCVDVTVPSGAGAPWSFPWIVTGDGYGGAPHSATGTWGPIVPVELQSFIVE